MSGAGNQGTVDAILMASGVSKRFGAENKLLAPFDGTPMALHVLRLVCGIPQFSRIFFVYADDAVSALADGLPVTAIHNIRPQRGQCESVRLGVKASEADFYAFFPCDTPLLDEATVQSVLCRRAPGKIVFPQAAGRPGNPAVFSSHFRSELLGLQDNEAPKTVKDRHPDSLIAVPVENARILADIDTKDELSTL